MGIVGGVFHNSIVGDLVDFQSQLESAHPLKLSYGFFTGLQEAQCRGWR